MSGIYVDFEGMQKHKVLVRAWLDGAKIQIKSEDGWCDCAENFPSWHSDEVYRIKPTEKLRLRPFDFDKWLVGESVRDKETGKRYVILAQTYDYVYFIDDYIDYGQLLEFYEFLDGSPCGKLDEQE